MDNKVKDLINGSKEISTSMYGTKYTFYKNGYDFFFTVKNNQIVSTSKVKAINIDYGVKMGMF